MIALWFVCMLFFGSPMRNAETLPDDLNYSHFRKDYSKAYLDFYRNKYRTIYNEEKGGLDKQETAKEK